MLINKTNGDIIAFMSLFADSIKLSSDEKETHDIQFIPFEAIPAIKIGQLAVDYKYNQRFKGIGSLMVELARGITEDIRNNGVSCRFITVDADTENNPSVVAFYLKNGFKLNEKYKKKAKVSMRLDLFADIEKADSIDPE
ncbi:MAG: N-acetyltransferase [Thermincolia bacterium]